MIGIYEWFNAHCGWIYNNMNMFHWMFTDGELEVPLAIIKCLVMSIWYMVIILAPLLIIIRGVGYLIGGWMGNLNAFFIHKED